MILPVRSRNRSTETTYCENLILVMRLYHLGIGKFSACSEVVGEESEDPWMGTLGFAIMTRTKKITPGVLFVFLDLGP